jgi:hypothetical protein
MAWYDDIANTTKGNVQGLINALRNPQDTIVNQFKQGALYKNKDALAALLRGDTASLMNNLTAKSPADPNEAMDVAMMLGTIKGVGNKLPLNELNTLNPTGGLYVDYTPDIRASQPLGKNMVSIDKTMGGSPDDIITIYRGAPKKQKSIVPGDFISDMHEVAKSYTGDNNVLMLKVRKGDVLDDINEPSGNEYLYRPNADKK